MQRQRAGRRLVVDDDRHRTAVDPFAERDAAAGRATRARTLSTSIPIILLSPRLVFEGRRDRVGHRGRSLLGDFRTGGERRRGADGGSDLLAGGAEMDDDVEVAAQRRTRR